MKNMLCNTFNLWCAMLFMGVAVSSDEFGWPEFVLMFACWAQIFVTQIDAKGK